MYRFWLLLKPDAKEIRNVYIYAVFLGLVQLSLPIGIQSIVNLIQGGQMSTSWLILVGCVILGIDRILDDVLGRIHGGAADHRVGGHFACINARCASGGKRESGGNK